MNPVMPNGFQPVIAGYGFGAPGGVMRTEVAGGSPRYALDWDRGPQQFAVTMILPPDKFSVFTAWFHHIIKKGAITFTMPLDSGFGLQAHDCNIVPGSYSATRVNGQVTSVAFSVDATSRAYDMTAAEAQTMVDVWNQYGTGSGALLARIARFATVDTNVLEV